MNWRDGNQISLVYLGLLSRKETNTIDDVHVQGTDSISHSDKIFIIVWFVIKSEKRNEKRVAKDEDDNWTDDSKMYDD